jgi:hypothetical protein
MGWRVRRLIPDGGEIFCFLTGKKIKWPDFNGCGLSSMFNVYSL